MRGERCATMLRLFTPAPSPTMHSVRSITALALSLLGLAALPTRAAEADVPASFDRGNGNGNGNGNCTGIGIGTGTGTGTGTGIGIGIGIAKAIAIGGALKYDHAEVIGCKAAPVADRSAAISDPALGEFNIRRVRLSYLDHGDRYDPKTRRATPSPEKARDLRIDPNAAGFSPHFTTEAFYPDVLGDRTVANLMADLIDNRPKEVVGLAFGAPDSPRPHLGFEFRFSEGEGSLGWYTGAFGGGEDHSVYDRLDVTPVRLARPLNTPLAR